MTSHRWGTWLHGNELNSLLGMSEDPNPNLFVDHFTLPEGAFRIFPGFSEEAPYLLRRLLAVTDEIADPAVRREVRIASLSVLGLSTALCLRIGLDVGQAVEGATVGIVQIPKGSEFAALKNAAFFTQAAVLGTVEQFSATGDVLSPFASNGDLTWERYSPETNPVVRAPLLRARGGLVVLAPHALLSAVNSWILKRLLATCGSEAVAGMLQAEVVKNIDSSLRRLRTASIASPRLTAPTAEMLYESENETLIHVVLFVDDLKSYGNEAGWVTDGFGALFDARARAVDAGAANWGWVARIIHILVLQGVGRGGVVGASHEGPSCLDLMIDGPDLEAFSVLNWGDASVLRQFAEASSGVRRGAKVVSFSTLDEYQAFRFHKNSYYMSDDRPPTAIMVPPGARAELYLEIHETHNIHGIRNPWTGQHEDVLSLHGDPTYPLYRRWAHGEGAMVLLLEAYDAPIWMRGPDEEPDGYRAMYVMFGEALLYWFWQLVPSLRGPMKSLCSGRGHLELRVLIEPSTIWTEPVENAETGEAWEYRPTHDGLEVHIRPGAAMRLRGSDNGGERELVSGLLLAMQAWATTRGDTSWRELDVASVIERHMPLGTKKMILLLDTRQNPRLWPGPLPDARLVQQCDQSNVLDMLGKQLQSRVWWKPGVKVPKDERTLRLKEAVAVLFEAFEAEVAALNPTGLLENLIVATEAAVMNEAFNRLRTVTQLACFGRHQRVARTDRDENAARSQAAVSTRFIAEYVVASPPTGKLELGIAKYDRLVALASEIISFGICDDEEVYGLADTEVEMLASGRLGARGREIEAARNEFSRNFASSQAISLGQEFPHHWEASTGPKNASLKARLNEASVAEFGISMSDIELFMATVTKIGLKLTGEAKMLPRVLFCDELGATLGWAEERVLGALNLFLLRPRDRFLPPPAPFVNSDVYPWRFNRGLSYLRRPLLLRTADDTILWGTRFMDVARVNLLSLCLTARLRARSPEMKVFLGTVKGRGSAEFNDRVYTLCKSRIGCHAEKNVKRVGKIRIVDDQNRDLGDIDVLVAMRQQRRVLAIEAKSIETARTPAELSHELKETFGVGDKAHGLSHIEKHQRRVQWLRTNSDVLLAWLGVDLMDRKQWRIDGLMVTENEHMSPLLRAPIMPVRSYREFSMEWVDTSDARLSF